MILTDEQWRLIQYLVPPAPQPVMRGLPFLDRRAVLDGILWKLSGHTPWQELPPDFPPWQTCASCYRLWRQTGVMQQVFLALYTDLADRGRLPLSRALRDGSLTLACTSGHVRFVVSPALEGTWQLATARLLLSLAIEDLRAGPRPSLRVRPARRR